MNNLKVENNFTSQDDLINAPSIVANGRQLCDLELLLSGAFSPLDGYMSHKDYSSVLNDMRLSDGSLWPIPITLDVSQNFIDSNNISSGSLFLIRDEEGVAIASISVTDIWEPDKKIESKCVYGTTDITHPGVDYLLNVSDKIYVGGVVSKLNMPRHYDFKDIRHTPESLKKEFDRRGWDKVVAFQTRNPMHKAHKEIAYRAAVDNNANLLIHPVVGMTRPGDVNHYTRVRCYKKILDKFPSNFACLSLLPLAMRMAGPREALWHALIRKNYGCTHIIIGRDHAGPGNGSDGKPFYGPYDAQVLVEKFQSEIGIEMVPFKMVVYAEGISEYIAIDEVSENENILNISGTEFRERLENGDDIPDWFSYPEVVDELRMVYPLKQDRGFTLFFTGLSGSGKSTIANGVMSRLMEHGKRAVTLLDGDLVRHHLSSELGFSKEHRDLNVTRIGFVASEITKNGGIAICAPIAPYSGPRNQNRVLISNSGSYIEVFVSTPLDVCEDRDVKGLYAKARAGDIKGFTGIDDPYEEPNNPEINIDTSNMIHSESVDMVINYLEENGYI